MLTAPLSRLQQTILRVAFQHRQKYGTQPENPYGHVTIDASVPELLSACYGAPTEPVRRHPEHPQSPRMGRLFTAMEVETGARAALSRALTRLQERGLVTIYKGRMSRWTGIQLTEEGQHVAADLPDVPGWPLPLVEPRSSDDGSRWSNERKVREETEAMQELRRIIGEEPGATWDYLHTRTGMSSRDLRKRLDNLVRETDVSPDQLVTARQVGRATHYYVGIPDEPEDEE